jgi:hypothetical protein
VRLDDVDGRDAAKRHVSIATSSSRVSEGTLCNRTMQRESQIISKPRPCFIYLKLCNVTAPKNVYDLIIHYGMMSL